MKKIREDLYLPVEIAGIKFKNPFYVASGPTTKSLKQLKRIEETGWAAASIKLTIDPSPYINRVPRYAIFNDRNALCFTAEKRNTFEESLKLVDEAKKVLNDLILMINITYAGDRGIAGWVNMAKEFENAGVDIIELNMCCPNMSYNLEISKGQKGVSPVRTGASLGKDGKFISELVREIKKEVKLPLFVKLTPEGGNIAEVAKQVYSAGADAVGSTSNRLGIPPIDLDNPAKSPYHLQKEISMSCHSGAWLKPLALRDVYEMRKVNGPKMRIMHAGGIRNYKDAVESIMCGADLLGICSETLISGFDFIREVISELKDYMDEHGYKSLADMRDLIVGEVKTASELTLYDGYAEIKEPRLAAPCKAACPHNVPAQAYVQMVAKGDFRRAYELIMSKNPLQSVCSWVCTHPCEDACTRGEIGEPIKIREIKRFVIEYAKKQGWKPELKAAKTKNEKVAVIGSGPAGLSCAYNLALAGYRVTVFEKENYLGGMVRYGLPKFRINHKVLDEEIDILKNLGIKFITNRIFGKDMTVNSLKSDGFAAIFMAIGAQNGRSLNIPGEDARGVVFALDFLKAVYDEKISKLGRRVIVLGDDYTAVDTARTARRLGAEAVYVVSKKGQPKKLALQQAVKEAEDEGIKFVYRVTTKEIMNKNGMVSGVKMINSVLEDTTLSSKELFSNSLSSEFILECDAVIIATGQQPERQAVEGFDLNKNGMLKINTKTCETSMQGVYAGGDVTRVATVISAIAEGKRAAVSIDKLLSGDLSVLEYEKRAPVALKESVLRRNGYFKDKGKLELYTTDGKSRTADFSTYIRTMTEEEAVKEAERCLNCGCGEGCSICANICSEFAIHLEENDVWKINKEECVACGMCYNRCPNGNIEMVNKNIIVK